MKPPHAASGICPICNRPTDTQYRPFCSRRCADVDLSRWLRGGISIEWVAARLLRRFADAQVALRRELAGGEAEDAVLDPAERERLRALGYLD